MKIVLREYRQEDREQLNRCIAELEEHVAHLDPLKRTRLHQDFDVQAYVDDLQRQVAKNEGIIFLAEAQGRIVGVIVGALVDRSARDVLEMYPLPHEDGEILELFVFEQWRGKKVGALLIQKMEDYFRSKGCQAIYVVCFAPNEDACRFYKRAGYGDWTHSLIKML